MLTRRHCCCPGGGGLCGTYAIPAADLSMAISPPYDMGTGAASSGTLAWNGSTTTPIWVSCWCFTSGLPGDCGSVGPSEIDQFWTLACHPGSTPSFIDDLEYATGTTCRAGSNQTIGVLVSHSTGPFQMVFHVTVGGLHPVTYTFTITP